MKDNKAEDVEDDKNENGEDDIKSEPGNNSAGGRIEGGEDEINKDWEVDDIEEVEDIINDETGEAESENDVQGDINYEKEEEDSKKMEVREENDKNSEFGRGCTGQVEGMHR